jgi:hypothetical protein
MAYSISDIREALAANLNTLDGVQVNPYLLSNLTVPSMQIMPAARDFHGAMNDGFAELHFTVQAFVALGLDQAAQMNLDKWLGEGDADALKDALESDVTLGGLVSDVTVLSVSAMTQFARDGQPALLGAEFDVRVIV